MSQLNRAGGAAVAIDAGPGPTPMRRVATACLAGSAVEFYDFAIYATAASLVFPTVFFPHLGPAMAAMATTASMGTIAAAFLSRPLGAAVFGYFGDRLGRKKTLVATLLIMALSTVAVGLLPTTAAIGAAAPLILIALRLLQGIAAGGEWAGSILGCFTFEFIASSYLATYAHIHLGYARNVVLFISVLGGLAEIAFIAFSAALCDRVGRRRMMLAGWAACVSWSIVVIPLTDTDNPICYAVAIVGMEAVAGTGLGPVAAFFPELFATRYRLQRNGAGANPRRYSWRRRAITDCRRAAGCLRRLGDRYHAGRRCRGQPSVHLSAAGNQRNSSSLRSTQAAGVASIAS
jgi:MFS family permease